MKKRNNYKANKNQPKNIIQLTTCKQITFFFSMCVFFNTHAGQSTNTQPNKTKTKKNTKPKNQKPNSIRNRRTFCVNFVRIPPTTTLLPLLLLLLHLNYSSIKIDKPIISAIFQSTHTQNTFRIAIKIEIESLQPKTKHSN